MVTFLVSMEDGEVSCQCVACEAEEARAEDEVNRQHFLPRRGADLPITEATPEGTIAVDAHKVDVKPHDRIPVDAQSSRVIRRPTVSN